MRTATFTICSANYLAYAKTLLASCAAAGIDDLYLFLADEMPPEGVVADIPAEIVTADALGMDGFADMAFRYTIMEFNTAIKPSCITHLFERGYDAVVYLDPDIFVLRPLTDVTDALEGGADMVLTPHICEPLEDGQHPGDVQILQSGAFNLGFGAFANTPDTRRFVDWWTRRLRFECVVDVPGGLFVDQRFVDLAPGFVSKLSILRHPGYNVAYWNQAHRTIERDGDGWTSNGEPLVFYHFSGVTPPSKSVYSKHQDRLSPADLGEGRALFETYVDRLVENRHEDLRKTRYAYGFFADGSPIPDVVRRSLRAATPTAPLPFDDPFTDKADVLERLNRQAAGLRRLGEVVVSDLMAFVWGERPDLQAAFTLTTAEGQGQFAGWFAATAPNEIGITQDMLPRSAVAAASSNAPAALGMRRAAASLVLANVNRLKPFYGVLPKGVRLTARNMLLRAQVPNGAPPRIIPSSEPKGGDGVAINGYFRAETGVGEGARRTARALEAVGVPITTRTIPSGASDHDALEWRTRHDADDALIVLSHVNADETTNMTRWLDPAIFDEGYLIGYWAWELERFPDDWLPAADVLHEIWTPSSFTKGAVARATDKPVHVVPHPLRPEPAPISDADRAEARAALGLDADDFAILIGFDVNSFPERKNPEGALEAFVAAQDLADATLRLVVKMHGKLANPERYEETRAKIADMPGVVLVEEVLDDEGLIRLQQSCDAFLSLHRSEGFGLMIAEMMQIGRPVIVTGYSGNMEFCTEENACIVRYEPVRVPRDAYPYWDGQVWADPDTAHAAELIARLADDRGFAEQKAEAGRRSVSEQLSPEAVGRSMKRRFAEIREAVGKGTP